jgi:hypothetical protein
MPSPTFELVVHHNYASGSATDLCGYRNHGHRLGDPDNHDGDITRFDGRASRVVVFPSATLTDLRGVCGHARLRLDRLGDRRTIVEGYLAFAFVVDPDGSLAASVYTGHRWEEVRTRPGAVPLGRWVDVGFLYDGWDTASLTIDGNVAAARYLPVGSVASVAWPYGLNIGAWPDRDLRVFDGHIKEMSLWRLAR